LSPSSSNAERRPPRTVEDELLRFGRLGPKVHHHHRVERIDRRHVEGDGVPIVAGLREGLQRVVPPGVGLIAIPRMEKLVFHPFTVGLR
jgi:hypothetical protein